jgi:putative ABC transport system permease protein
MNRWQRLLRRTKMEEQLEKEMRFHLEQHANELIAGGASPAEARRRARVALGGPEQVKEECRDARGTRWLEDFWQDFRYALRMLRQHPSFAAVAILTLALGVGASTVMFTVVNGVLLRPLPYPQSDKLVAVNGHTDTWNAKLFGEQNVAYPDFLDFERESHSLTLAGILFNGGTASGAGEPEYVNFNEVSPDVFSVLRVALAEGRTFLAEDDTPGAAPVMILGYSFWQRHFGGKVEVLGSSLVLDGRSYTIVGIAPAGFRLYDSEPDVYTPLGQDTAGYLRNRGAHPVHVLARLRPGRTLAEAQAELRLIGSRLAAQYKDTNRERSFVVHTLRPDVGVVRSTLWLLLGAVGLVLLIACTNVASLLLARAVSRERELAMRVALGAGRGQLVRQCLTESAVLGLSGGALGVGLAALGFQPFVAFWPGSLPRAEEVQLDWRVLLFGLTVSLVSGLVFGLAPALRAPARELEQMLRAGGRSVVGSSRRLHSSFVVSELALAVVLLVSAGMLGRTLLRLSSLDPGMNTRNVLVARMALSPGVLADTGRIRAAWQDVLERARRVPGVESVAIVDTFPMREGFNAMGYWPTADVPPENKQPQALATSVSPEYLNVMGIPLRQGRLFNEQDRMGSELVVVIDDVLAQQAFGGESAVGKRLWMPDTGYGPFVVVGVVGHVRHWGLAGDDQAQVRAQFYYPFAQLPDRLLRRWSELMSIVVRTSVRPLSEVASLKRELRGAAGDQIFYEVHTMEQLASESLARQRFLLLLFGIFAGLALVLACIGVYGVLAYLTGRRVPEIGIRIALGASPSAVMWMVLRQSLGMIFVGVVLGTAGALAAGRVLKQLVEGMQAIEISSFATMIPVLVFAALLASFLPARHASRVDPVIALRQE